MAESMRVAVGSASVTAMLYPAGAAAALHTTLILGHGAGAPQSSPFMVDFAEGLARRGAHTVTFNFPYMEEGRRLPDRAATLEASFRAVIDAMRARAGLASGRLVGVGIGGRGAGERIAEAALAVATAALVGDVAVTIHAHPTLSETLMEAAENLLG